MPDKVLKEEGLISMSVVVLIRCESYDDNNVKKAMERGIDLLGGDRPNLFQQVKKFS